jgi:hypothetical protein
MFPAKLQMGCSVLNRLIQLNILRGSRLQVYTTKFNGAPGKQVSRVETVNLQLILVLE